MVERRCYRYRCRSVELSWIMNLKERRQRYLQWAVGDTIYWSWECEYVRGRVPKKFSVKAKNITFFFLIMISQKFNWNPVSPQCSKGLPVQSIKTPADTRFYVDRFMTFKIDPFTEKKILQNYPLRKFASSSFYSKHLSNRN